MTVNELRILHALNIGFGDEPGFWASIDGIMEALDADGLPPVNRHAVVATLGQMEGLGGGMGARRRRLKASPLIETKPKPNRRERNLYRMTDWGLKVLGA